MEWSNSMLLSKVSLEVRPADYCTIQSCVARLLQISVRIVTDWTSSEGCAWEEVGLQPTVALIWKENMLCFKAYMCDALCLWVTFHPKSQISRKALPHHWAAFPYGKCLPPGPRARGSVSLVMNVNPHAYQHLLSTSSLCECMNEDIGPSVLPTWNPLI